MMVIIQGIKFDFISATKALGCFVSMVGRSISFYTIGN